MFGQCEKSLRATEEAVAAACRAREEKLERLAAVWDVCEASGIKLGPSAFDESNHEQRNAFLPLADEDQVRRNYLLAFDWVRLGREQNEKNTKVIDGMRERKMNEKLLAQNMCQKCSLGRCTARARAMTILVMVHTLS